MKKKILMIVILVLVLAFLVVPGSLAIYRTISNPNGDVALATWNIELDQSEVNNHISITAGDATSVAHYTLNIVSNAQVDIIYSIVLNNLPTGTSVELDNSGTFIQESSGTVIFNEIGTINYSDLNKNRTHTLAFKAASGATYVTDQAVDVNVIARQTLH